MSAPNGPFELGPIGWRFKFKQWLLSLIAGKDAVVLNCSIGKDGAAITIKDGQDLYAGTAQVIGGGVGLTIGISVEAPD